jgi:hypothetical protein
MLIEKINTTTLVCKICNEQKEVCLFKKYREKGKPAIKPFCIECSKIELTKYKQYKKDYYLKNKDFLVEKNNLYKENNKEKMTLYFKEYNENRKEQLKEYRKEYFQKNKKRINEKAKLDKQRNPNIKIAHSLRNRIIKVLNGSTKKDSTFNLLGCTIAEFKLYLESQFTETMSWENYGSIWHIDHILPCASFDLSEESQQRLCFNYRNLQPLLAHDNLVKGKKIL